MGLTSVCGMLKAQRERRERGREGGREGGRREKEMGREREREEERKEREGTGRGGRRSREVLEPSLHKSESCSSIPVAFLRVNL